MSKYKCVADLIADGKFVKGWMTDVERSDLFALAETLQPGQRVLEIGVYGGTTVSLFALVAPPGVEIIGLDSWENDTPNTSPVDGRTITIKDLCQEQLRLNGVADRVSLVHGSSHTIGPHWHLPLDVLIVDGDHSYEGALQDLRDFARHVVPGGLVIVDDYGTINDVRLALAVWLKEEPVDRWETVRTYADATIGKAVWFRRVGA